MANSEKSCPNAIEVMMDPIISIIVPVYGVEPYLRKCIDSICGQTLQQIEIILVDDGSPDNCGQICDEYAAQDSRIRVIHKENGGLSSARNTGIDAARCDILGFVDSDDWVEPDMFELLYRNMVRENADISVCGRYQHVGKHVVTYGDGTCFVRSGTNAIRSVYENSGVGAVVWNKLFRRHLFHSLPFPEGKIAEDNFIILRLFDAANAVVFDLKPKYHYLKRAGSIIESPYRPAVQDIIEASMGNHAFVLEKHPQLASIAWENCLNYHIVVLITLFLHSGSQYAAIEKEHISVLKSNWKAILSSAIIPKKRKIIFLLLWIHPALCKLLVHAGKRYQRSRL